MKDSKEIKGWIIHKCPDFYFMPSLRYDQIFTQYGSVDEKMSCAYWVSVGFEAIPLYECINEEAEYWIVNDNYGVFDLESAKASIFLGKSVIPVKTLK